VAKIADCPPDQVQEGSRLIEDVGLDSLSLAELVVILIEKYDMFSLSQTLEERSWEKVTVRSLYDEYLTGLPPRARSSATA
jgi:acyl carrier protein